MRGERQLTVGHVVDFRRGLQLPVLATGLHVAAGQAPAPVAFVEIAVQRQGQFDQRTGQVELDFLVLDIALSAGGQGADLGVTGLNAVMVLMARARSALLLSLMGEAPLVLFFFAGLIR